MEHTKRCRGSREAILFASSLLLLLLVGCYKDKVPFDKEMLYGEWYSADYNGGFYYIFNSDASGAYRDNNGEGKSFTWELNDKHLTIKVNSSGPINITAFETYVIVSLDANTLKMYDELDESQVYIYKRVKR